MQALTIKEPWLSYILFHGKDIENRSYQFPARAMGRLIALHTSKAIDKNVAGYPTSDLTGVIDELLPLGSIVAIARITNSSIDCQSPWAKTGSHHWQITVEFILPTPLAAKGQLGLWQIPSEIEAAMLEQIKGLNKDLNREETNDQ